MCIHILISDSSSILFCSLFPIFPILLPPTLASLIFSCPSLTPSPLPRVPPENIAYAIWWVSRIHYIITIL